MTSVPYPTFRPSFTERYSMAAVGRCRITVSSDNDSNVLVRQIIQKCTDQANCGSSSSSSSNSSSGGEVSKEDVQKLQKKYMKESVAMASNYMQHELHLDVSIIDVEVYLPNISDIINTNGNIVSCLLDAGCSHIVIPYDMTTEMDHNNNSPLSESYHQIVHLMGIPRDRLMVHLVSAESKDNDATTSSTALLSNMNTRLLERLQQDCCAVSVLMPNKSTKNEICKVFDMSKALSDFEMIVQIDGSNNMIVSDTVMRNNNHNKTEEQDFATVIGTILQSYSRKDRRNHTTISLIDPTPELLGLSYTACMTTDRTDSLFTTVVVTRTNEALGLVYSSKESIVAALQCGRGVYYSRSRNSLWRKGDTSGHYQTLHRIDVDCDGDAIRFTVTQNSPTTTTMPEVNNNNDNNNNNNNNNNTDDGAVQLCKEPASFCHLNTLTCWGPSRGIRHLESTLQDRLYNAPEGSYTQRLFQDTTLLRNKLVEEAQELAEADTSQHVAEELADVLYFSLVRAAQFGITLEDAVIELDRRSRKVTRRAGDSKSYRIEAAQAILNENK